MGCDWRLFTSGFKGTGNIFKPYNGYTNVHFFILYTICVLLFVQDTPKNSERFVRGRKVFLSITLSPKLPPTIL